MLSINTLGKLGISVDAASVKLGNLKAALTLVYLRHHAGREVFRSELTELLWGADSPQTRHSLSQAIYTLRHTIAGLPLEVSRDSVILRATGVSYDVEDLQRATRSGLYAIAGDLYKGRFLGGFAELPTVEFEQWADQVARTTAASAALVFRYHLRQAETSADWQGVELWANKLLDLEEFDEEAHAYRIRATAALLGGESASRMAIEVRAHFGAAVGSITSDDLRRTCERYANFATVLPAPSTEPMLRGRQEEFRVMADRWGAADAGFPQLAFVSGLAGIGKTRLCNHYLKWAAIRGSRILTAKAAHSDTHMPFAVGCQLLRSGVGGREMGALADPWRRWVATLLPEYADSGSVEADKQARPDQRGLFEAVARLLAPLCRRAPLMVFVDDVDLADQPTSSLIHFLFHRLTGERLVVVLASRRHQEDLQEQISILLKSLDGTRSCVLPLGPLDHAAATQVARDVLIKTDERTSLELCATIAEEAGGVPFFIVESAAKLEAPVSVQSNAVGHGRYATLATIRMLPASALTTLRALAVLGFRAPRSLVKETSNLSAADFADALDYLTPKRLLRVTGTHLEFDHDLIREAVLAEMNEEDAKRLNREAAAAISRFTVAPAGRLAIHYIGADMPVQAFAAAMKAASEAGRLRSNADMEFYLQLAISKAPDRMSRHLAHAALVEHFCAAERYMDALSTVVKSPGTWEHLQPETAKILQLYRMLADASRSIPEVLAALETLWQSGSSDPPNEGHLRLMRAIVSFGIFMGSPAVRSFIRRTAESLSTIRESPEAAKLYASLARTWTLVEGGSRAIEFANHGVKIALETGDSDAIAMALISRATVYLLQGDLINADRDFGSCAAVVEDPHSHMNAERLLVNRAVLLIETCRAREAEQHLERVLGGQLPLDGLPIRGNLAIAALEMKDSAQLLRRIRELRNVNAGLRVAWVDYFADCMEAYYCRQLGDIASANRLISRLAAAETAGGSQALGPEPSYAQALIAEYIAGASEDSAMAYLGRAAESHSQRNALGEIRVRLVRAEILLRQNPEAGRRELRELTARCKSGGALTLLGHCERLAQSAVF